MKRAAKIITKSIRPEYYSEPTFTLGSEIGYETGNLVTRLYYRTKEYAIYEINHSGVVEYITTNDEVYNTSVISAQLTQISFWLYESDTILGTVSGKSPVGDKSLLDPINESIADCISLCFQKRDQEARSLVERLSEEVKNEVFKWSKLYYLIPCIFIALVFGFLAIWLKTGGSVGWFPLLKEPDIHMFAYMAAMGSAGGLFSIARNIGSYNVLIKRRKNILYSLFGYHWVGVLVRMMTAVLGSIFILILFRSGLFTIEGINEVKPYSLYALGIIGGFSQNFVPGLLTTFEKQVKADLGRSSASGNALIQRDADLTAV